MFYEAENEQLIELLRARSKYARNVYFCTLTLSNTNEKYSNNTIKN